MRGPKKLMFLALLLVAALAVLPFLVVPLPYEGLDWITLSHRIYYDETPEPGPPRIYLPVNLQRAGDRSWP